MINFRPKCADIAAVLMSKSKVNVTWRGAEAAVPGRPEVGTELNAIASDDVRSRATRHEAIHEWMASHASAAPGHLLTAVFLRGMHEAQLIASHPASQPVTPWLAELAARAIAQREPIVISRHSEHVRAVQGVAHPLYQGEMLVGAAVVLREGGQPLRPEDLGAMQASSARFPQLMATTSAPEHVSNLERTVLTMLGKMAGCDSIKDGAEVLALALASKLECDRVSVGMRCDNATSLLASSQSSTGRKSAHTADVLAAMDEAADQGCTLVHPPDMERRLCLLAAHAQLADRARSLVICTVPLVWRGEVVGTLLVERQRAAAFLPAEIALIELVASSAAPWLQLQRQAEMPWYRHLGLQLTRSSVLFKHGRYHLGALAGMLVLVGVLGWPVEREVTAPVKLEGQTQRIVAAPGDSFLEKVNVRPGDVVKAGQVLLEFASEDLRAERERLQAELGGRDAAAAEAMAKQDLGALAVQSAKVKETQAQIELLDQRLKRMRITAPFDAVVIQGDLANALGAPTRKGDLLMTLAPAGSYRAIVEVDESDIAEVRKGQTGAMVLTALPHSALPLRVKGVTPLATAAQGRSYFEAEVELMPVTPLPSDLRPGMRGIARLEGAQRARGAVWLEQAHAWCRLAWWRWIG